MFSAYHTLMVNPVGSELLIVALNRPDSANALNMQMGMELENAFSTIAAKANSCRAVLLTGHGKHFCAGADLKERKGISDDTWQRQHEMFEKALLSILYCPVPVIAAVHGAAMGGGLELALACDFIYAADNARFALTEATLGIMPGLGGTQNLPRAIGQRRAKEMLFTGKRFSAAEAHAWGMVNAIFTPDALLDEALKTAKRIMENAPLSLRNIKTAMQEGAHLPLKEALACELKYYNTLLTSKDRHEGINAFNEKRKPAFTGN